MLVPDQDISGGKPSSQYRYSKSKFQKNLIIAAAMTAMVCGFTWLLVGISGSIYQLRYTAIVGLIFFAFMSANTLRLYMQNDVILAIRPTGLFDARWSNDFIEWERVKEISLGQREHAYILSVWLWPAAKVRDLHPASAEPTFKIDLEPLDGEPSEILNLINEYKPVRMDQ